MEARNPSPVPSPKGRRNNATAANLAFGRSFGERQAFASQKTTPIPGSNSCGSATNDIAGVRCRTPFEGVLGVPFAREIRN
jgi:hypothetical protein